MENSFIWRKEYQNLLVSEKSHRIDVRPRRLRFEMTSPMSVIPGTPPTPRSDSEENLLEALFNDSVPFRKQPEAGTINYPDDGEDKNPGSNSNILSLGLVVFAMLIGFKLLRRYW